MDINKLIIELENTIKTEEGYTDTLHIVKIILQQYDKTIFITRDEMKEKIDNILDSFYS